MDYKIYQQSRDAVWQLLLDLNICELPVSVTKICKELNIKVKLYEPRDDNDGYSYIKDGQPYIFISKNATVQRQRFTAAHELGHIILCHIGKYKLMNREPSAKDNPIEQAANVFASRLLAPACVLWGLGVTEAMQIVKICDISLLSAEYRMKRMNELYIRNLFLTSHLEPQVFEQFKPFINEHKLKQCPVHQDNHRDFREHS